MGCKVDTLVPPSDSARQPHSCDSNSTTGKSGEIAKQANDYKAIDHSAATKDTSDSAKITPSINSQATSNQPNGMQHSPADDCSKLLTKQNTNSLMQEFDDLTLPETQIESQNISKSDKNPGKLASVVFVLGGPGSGKGTQCALIQDKFGYVHLSAGDLLRAERNSGSSDGDLINDCIKSGKIVPVSITVQLIRNAMKLHTEAGQFDFLVDGFPRNQDNFDGWFDLMSGFAIIRFVLVFECSQQVMMDRLLQRAQTSGRVDDNRDSILKRFSTFEEETQPIIHVFKEQSLVREIDCSGTKEEVFGLVQQHFVKARIVLGKDEPELQHTLSPLLEDLCLGLTDMMIQTRVKFNPHKFLASFLLNKAKQQELEAELLREPMEAHIFDENYTAPQIIIAGAPASGKGTQCELLKATYRGIAHISTGDMLRAAVSVKSELGKQAEEYMNVGRLVPDSIVIGLVRERMSQPDCKRFGYMLDGFPRTRAQADALSSKGVYPSHFVLIDVPDDILIDRVVGRRQDPDTGRIYHLKFNPPESEEIAQRLIQRDDDTVDAISVRLQSFHKQIGSILEAYSKVLLRVDGNRDKNSIFSDIFSAIHARSVPPNPIRLIIAGPPGSGKGTQSALLKAYYRGVVHISTGDMLRQAVVANTDLGKQAQVFMDSGRLVPDDLIIDLVRGRLAEHDCMACGYIFDGFPRTRQQAMALSAVGINPQVLMLSGVSRGMLVTRSTGRRIDPVTGNIYHVDFYPPDNPDVFNRLITRSDDVEDAVNMRINEYNATESDIVHFYDHAMVTINGDQTREAVCSEIVHKLGLAK